MASENRALMLEGIFGQMAEHFDADGGGDVEAIIDWKIWDRPDGGYDHWRVEISNGTCRLRIDGDLMLAARMQSYFRVPRAS